MNLTMIAWWVVVLGAVNVGLAAIGFNIVEMISVGSAQIAQILYLLIGAAGLYYLLTAFGGSASHAKKKKKR